MRDRSVSRLAPDKLSCIDSTSSLWSARRCESCGAIRRIGGFRRTREPLLDASNHENGQLQGPNTAPLVTGRNWLHIRAIPARPEARVATTGRRRGGLASLNDE